MIDTEYGQTGWVIEQLVYHYAALLDAQQWEELAALFMEDGVLVRPSGPREAIQGRDLILASMRARAPRTSRHVFTNVRVSFDGDASARVRSLVLLFTGPDAPILGEYDDRLVLTPDGWRFARREGRLLFR